MTHMTIRIPIEKDDLIIPFTDQDLLRFIGGYRRQINDYVIGQLEDQDDGPHLSDFSISRLLFHADNTCSFRLHFKIDRQFCCSDMLSCQMDYMDFIVNKSDEDTTLTGAYTTWTIQ